HLERQVDHGPFSSARSRDRERAGLSRSPPMNHATSASGSLALMADSNAIGSGNATTPPFCLAMARMIRAAAASAVMRNGVADSIGAMAVLTYPGQIVVTVIPLLRSEILKPSM